MSKTGNSTIEVKGAAVTVLTQNQQDFISITDIARYKDAERTDYLISNWLRNRNTIESAVPKDRTLELFFPLVDSDLRGRRCCRKEPADSRRGWERDFFASAPSKATALEWRPLRLRIKIRE